MEVNSIVPVPEEEKTLRYWAPLGKKREYIYDYGKAKSCHHSRLREMVQGSNWYRCEDCNYALFIMTAYEQPLHNVVLAGLQNALHFSKEFGIAALQEVARRRTGQYDGRAQKAVIPEGMDFFETLEALEEVDVTAPDGGEQQLRSMQSAIWNGRGYLKDGRAKCLSASEKYGPRQRHKFGSDGLCIWCQEINHQRSLEGESDNSRKELVGDRGVS